FPRFQLTVLIAWFHRMVALLTSVMLFGTVGWMLIHPATRARVGGIAALAVALLFVQVLLGALTVWKLLSPSVVSSHLAVALLLLVTLLTLALRAQSHADEEAAAECVLTPAAAGGGPPVTPGPRAPAARGAAVAAAPAGL